MAKKEGEDSEKNGQKPKIKHRKMARMEEDGNREEMQRWEEQKCDKE